MYPIKPASLNLIVPNELTRPIPGKSPLWMTQEKAVCIVKSNDHIFIQGAAATPRILISALAQYGRQNCANLRNVRIHHLNTEGSAEYNRPEFNGIFRSNSLFTAQNCREAVQCGRADYTPIFLGEIPQIFSKGIIKPDVSFVSVTPADQYGFHSLGTSVDITRSALLHSKFIIGQVNPHLPRTYGESIVHTSHFDVLVHGSQSLINHEPKVLSKAERAIGKLISENLVQDGATLQMGIGGIPDAVLRDLGNHRDLGVHSEMLSDGVIDLCKSGVITNRCKRLQAGKLTASFMMGSQRLYDFVHDNSDIAMYGSDYVNDEFVIAQNPKVTAINSCLEMDIFGQVCSDSIGEKIYSGFGGQVDFLRGAAKSLDGQGKPILAMTSVTNKGESKIGLELKPGAGVVTTRAHVHYAVTEHGIAQLFGKTLRQRAYEMIKIAHPDAREELERGAFKKLKCMPSPD